MAISKNRQSQKCSIQQAHCSRRRLVEILPTPWDALRTARPERLPNCNRLSAAIVPGIIGKTANTSTHTPASHGTTEDGWPSWSKAAVLKTAESARAPGVRIPPHPLFAPAGFHCVSFSPAHALSACSPCASLHPVAARYCFGFCFALELSSEPCSRRIGSRTRETERIGAIYQVDSGIPTG